ncbi:MAG: DUF4160 domain-containing protein [Planctomycetota bacterium]
MPWCPNLSWWKGWGTRRAGLFDEEVSRYPIGMPEISRFFGIIIAMYDNHHEPAHFHARYG